MADAAELIEENKKTRSPFLDLGNCGLSEVPPEVSELTWLESLTFASHWVERDGALWSQKRSQNGGEANTLHGGIHSLRPLTGLRQLILHRTKADITPLAALTALQHVDLTGTPVTDITPLAALTALQHLQLGETEVTDVTPLAALTALKTLHLWDTGVIDVTPLAALTALHRLNLSGTMVTDVTPLAALTALQFLSLSGTRVTDLTPLAALRRLAQLGLHNTRVADLTPLRSLISDGVEVEWDELSWEPGIHVRGCPLTTPPPEIVRQGNQAILNYFNERDQAGQDRLYEAKLLILGEGGAGKTSLLRRLYDPTAPLPSEDESTKGIAIHRHEFPLPNGRRFRLNVWDFGGQEVYHHTHQFFLTRRSLYILVDDTRQDHRSVSDPGFKYPLELVDIFGGHSPVLIFQNEKGGRSKQLDLPGIKGRFDNVKDVYRGDLQHPGTADSIRQGIEHFAATLPHIGDELPATWVKVRAEIEQRASLSAHCTRQEYLAICQRHLGPGEANALHLSRYLHDLGVFLHFQDHPLLARTVILRNEWATEAVYRILDDEPVKARHGLFTEEDCGRVWSHSAYAEMHPELRGLMEKFELCYELRDCAQTTWLAPQLLPPSKPSKLADWQRDAGVVIRYRYQFLPRGTISRLIVRLNRFLNRDGMAWRTGVLFTQDRTEALVELLPQGNEIEIRAQGPDARALLTVITSDLEALNNSIPGLEAKVDKLIPCIGPGCKTQPHFFRHRDLKRARDLNVPQVQCQKEFTMVSVDELLEGIKPGSVPLWAREPTKVFIACSSELKEDRDALENDLHRPLNGRHIKVQHGASFLDAMSPQGL
ncbi:MAG: hypothetical protein FJW40_05670 [Acidobacteria bacterium]|nr:hypothetical protein [Acidobacteriota bacterium]